MKLRKTFWNKQFEALLPALNLNKRVEINCADGDLALAFVKVARLHKSKYHIFEIVPADVSRYLPVGKR